MGCSVGIYGVSMELIKELVKDETGKQAMVDWYSSILHSGELPAQWQDVLLVLLPKKDSPSEPKHTRGIAMGCTAEKIFRTDHSPTIETIHAFPSSVAVLCSTQAVGRNGLLPSQTGSGGSRMGLRYLHIETGFPCCL